MHATLCSLVLIHALAAGQGSAGHATLLSYRGKVSPLLDDRSPAAAEKTFDLTLLVAQPSPAETKVYWLVEESGKGGWPWPARFGVAPVDACWQAEESLRPALLYDHGDAQSVIPLVFPLLAAEEPLAPDMAWSREPWSFRVLEAERLQDREVWRVEVSNNYGPKRTLWVDQAGPLAVSLRERVFMGMGDEYQLELQLTSSKQLAGDEFQAYSGGFEALLALRSKLNVAPRSDVPNLSEKQLELLQQELPEVEKQITQGPLARLVRSARRDLGRQAGRADAVKELAAQHVGLEAGEFKAEGAGRESLSSEQLGGEVTLLHFWDYRDAPLKEPYGQVGYLDFLYQRHKAAGLKLYGVAVDSRLADEATRSAAIRSVRKLKTFMNLSYPVLLDSGELLARFGDPREVGAELPLFVLIGPDGKIAHYHVGVYEVDRNEGLKELNQAVSDLLARRDLKPQ